MSDKTLRFIGRVIGYFVVGILCLGTLWVFLSLLAKAMEALR